MITIIKKKLNKNIKKKKLKLRKRSIQKLSERMGWKGNGSETSPITIDSFSDIPLQVDIKNVDTHIRIKNLRITKLDLIYCQNILIEDCNVYSLFMERCRNITVKSSTFFKVEQFLNRGNKFEDNIISEESFTRLENNYYDNRNYKMIYIGLIFIVAFTFHAIRSAFYSNDLWSSAFLMFFGFLGLGQGLYFLMIRRQTRKIPPNIYLGFKVLELQSLTELFNTNFQPTIIS